MDYPEKEIRLKDGNVALFRGPKPEDAPAALAYMARTAAETPFLLRSPGELTLTMEEEAHYLARAAASRDSVMILCFVDGHLAGTCSMSRHTKRKNAHRASIGIALLEAYWGLGIGTAMFRELMEIARKWGLYQVELEVFEGNERAMGLYRKMGFETVSFVPNAIRLEDGTYLKEYLMVKVL